MDKKIISFFWKSLLGVIIVCIALFMFLLFFMSSRTNDTIYDVGANYMSAVNEQVQQKFTSIIDIELDLVNNVIAHIDEGRDGSKEDQIEGLIHSAQIINLAYLGFYYEDGRLEKVYGDHISEITADDMTFNQDGSIITRGIDDFGNSILVLGQKYEFPMPDGENSVAIVAATPMEQLNEALFLKENADEMYSHIIDSDGNFMIRNGDAYRENYFDRIEGSYGTYKGKTPAVYREELEEAIRSGEDYSTTFVLDGEVRLLYCSKINQTSDWYLLTIMPESVLSATIMELDHMRITAMTSILVIILALMTGVLLWYYRLSR